MFQITEYICYVFNYFNCKHCCDFLRIYLLLCCLLNFCICNSHFYRIPFNKSAQVRIYHTNIKTLLKKERGAEIFYKVNLRYFCRYQFKRSTFVLRLKVLFCILFGFRKLHLRRKQHLKPNILFHFRFQDFVF